MARKSKRPFKLFLQTKTNMRSYLLNGRNIYEVIAPYIKQLRRDGYTKMLTSTTSKAFACIMVHKNSSDPIMLKCFRMYDK